MRGEGFWDEGLIDKNGQVPAEVLYKLGVMTMILLMILICTAMKHDLSGKMHGTRRAGEMFVRDK